MKARASWREAKRALRSWRHILPAGRNDAILQFLILFTAYIAYDLVRFFTTGRESTAIANAQHIIHAEKGVRLYVEPWVQAKVSHVHLLVQAMDWFYANMHIPVTIGFLAWVYLRRNDVWAVFRNGFLLVNAIAVSTFALLPVAPPRLVPTSGLVDTLFVFSKVNYESGGLASITNPFAAVPSLHFGYALFVTIGIVLLSRALWARLLAVAYTLVVLVAIVVTGNHFLFDALAGGFVIMIAYLFTLSGSTVPETVAVRYDEELCD